FYLHYYNDTTLKADNALYMSTGKTGLAVEWLGIGAGPTYRRYTVAQAIALAPNLFVGGSYSWFGSNNVDLDKLSSLSLGLMARPLEYVSYGFRAEDLNHPTYLGKREAVKFSFGMALRPGTDRLTLSVEGSSHENQSFLTDANYLFRAEAEIARGIILQTQMDDNAENIFWGIRFNFPGAGVGSFNSYGDNGNFRTGVSYIGLSSHRYRSVLERKNNYVVVGVSGNLPEEARRGNLKSKDKTMREVLEMIQRAEEDNSVSGLLLVIHPLGCGLAKIQELREALKSFQAGNKNVIAYLEEVGTKEYYLASAADQIVMVPSGYLDFSGLSAQVTFLKGTLDKLGIVADMEHIGRYKNASDLLTRDSMSEAHREVVNSVLDDYYEQLAGQIAADRGITVEQVKEKINHGPYTAAEAKDAGLVDQLVYADEIEEVVLKTTPKKLSLLDRQPRLLHEKEFAGRKPYRYSWRIDPQIAVIYVTGMITSGGSGGGLFFGNSVGSYTVATALRSAAADRKIKSIVVRIDSPGGSGMASDVIHREMLLAREKKPVIVSMSDVAASGGYYASLQADEVLSSPATLTGSIGVISGKFSMEGFYKKIGLTQQTEKRGEFADIFSASRTFSDAEREIIRRQIGEFYSDFVGKVAQARNLDTGYVDSIAQGRVWTGQQALANRLVDRHGGLLTAIELAKLKAGIGADEKVEIVPLPEYRSPLPFGLDRLLGFYADIAEVKGLLEGNLQFPSDQILYLTPYQIEVE
ncbi:MAG: signal peptide peptidase SppA, partial [candidate division Zixibacteria bacterium]|nr:signal peptide peptidase SppA [candidate division Zixibacteria bacterium]